MKRINKIALLFLCLALAVHIHAQDKIAGLVFSKTNGFRHPSIAQGKAFLVSLGEKHNMQFDFSEDSAVFTDTGLAKYDLIVLLNTTGDIFGVENQKALQNFLGNGKGVVGIHSATDTEMQWPWYVEMIGASFRSHPKVQSATIEVNQVCMHPATAHLGEQAIFTDEWYDFKSPVAAHANVLMSLDETSYVGGKMGEKHPASWYHHYDGGRVFYTLLGHRPETFSDPRFEAHVLGGIFWATGQKGSCSITGKWKNLFEGNPKENWDIFMGVPHASITGIPDVDPESNGMNGIALGLNNDPKDVFTFEEQGDETVLHISGEIYGALTSKQEYENYHLRLQFKWGEKKWEPRINRKRDSGILYHCVGPFRRFWNVWMQSQEFQVQESDVGDYYGLSTTIIEIPAAREEGVKELAYKKGAEMRYFSAVDKNFPSHLNKGLDNENPHGEWNTLDLICVGGNSLHIVNGKVAMALYNSQYQTADGEIKPLTKGRIQLQSEGAEIFYKNIEIKSISEIPRKFKKQL